MYLQLYMIIDLLRRNPLDAANVAMKQVNVKYSNPILYQKVLFHQSITLQRICNANTYML